MAESREILAAPDALNIADALANDFATTAIERDRKGGVPKRERELLRKSGLLNLVIPRAQGGHGASWAVTLRTVRRIAEADGSIAHVYGFQHLLLATLRLFGPPEQYEPLFAATVRESWFWGNALNPLDTRAELREQGSEFVVDGAKSFASGAGDSDRLVISANRAPDHLGDRKLVVAAVPTSREGIQVVGDWDNMGQRQTDSGTVVFRNVRVLPSEILATPGPLGSPFASLRPCIAQLTLANVYLGIARGALEEAKRHTRARGKAWFLSGIDEVAKDPYVLHHFGELFVELEAARLLAEQAASELDEAWALGDAVTPERRGRCAVAIAMAKTKATRAGLDVVNRMFDVAGARATTAKEGLDRFWRNLRTHTLHDPVDYKLKELGAFVLSGELPAATFYS
jgi:alkylation response protein AidB-like acyl-CoA dehydrogenase